MLIIYDILSYAINMIYQRPKCLAIEVWLNKYVYLHWLEGILCNYKKGWGRHLHTGNLQDILLNEKYNAEKY